MPISMMRNIIKRLFFLVLVLVQQNSFSTESASKKDLSLELLNSHFKSITGLTIKDLSSLYSYKREKYISEEIIYGYGLDNSYKNLIELNYIQLVKAYDLALDISQGENFYIIKLTQKGQHLINTLEGK